MIGELFDLIKQRKFADARKVLEDMNVVDVAEMFTEWAEEDDDEKQIVLAFRILPKEMSADVFSYLESDLQQKIVEAISDKELGEILDELFMDDTVDFIEEMPANIVKRVIKVSSADERKLINQLLMYPESSAGSLMTIEYMEVDDEWTVEYAIRKVRQQAQDKETFVNMFVTDDRRHLVGLLKLRDLLSASDDDIVKNLIETDIISVYTHTEQEEVAEMFKKYDLVSMPVVDNENRLVGIITIDDIVDVMEEETTEDIYKMAAMEPIEDSYMETGVFTLAKKRIVWLMVLMISATFTGMIIQNFDAVLTSNIILSSFIPMLMDTSGNAGSQASVSVIRGIVLGEIEFKNIFKVMWKEFRVSLVVGIGIAVFDFIGVTIIYRDPLVAMVVGITIFCAIIAAKLVGCTLPIIATKLKLDPALMASPMITTIVDAVSLLVYFNVASYFLPLV